MTNRVSSRTIIFQRPFVLDEIERELPAGPYLIETEEEPLDGVSFLAYRRVSTHITVQARGGRSAGSEMWAINPDGLEAAVAQDQLPPNEAR